MLRGTPRKEIRWLAAAVVLQAVVAVEAAATQFQLFDRADQVQGSDAIITGRILSVQSRWSPDHSAIVSDAEVAVDEVWKGTVGDRLVVRTFGGRVGDVALEVEGAAQFASGERVLLYLRRSAGVYEPFGMRFGKYRVSGSGADSIATGSLPPTTKGEQTFPTVSLPLARLRTQVGELVKGENK
jgi:hypothetical protein